jgi:leucyl aminopeptidase
MKIRFSPQPLNRAPKGFTRVEFIEGGQTRFVERGSVQTLQIGLKKQSEITRRKLRLLCRQIIATAKQNKIQKLAIQWDRTDFGPLADIPYNELAVDVATAFEMANYEHLSYKTNTKDIKLVTEVLLMGQTPKGGKEAYQRGLIIGEEINACRELANTPGGDMTPQKLAEAAKGALKGTKATVKTLNMHAMEELGMGGVVGVGKGAADKPMFIIMEYWGAPKSIKPVVLVGKGVTFDTGGIQVKTGDHMYEMHMDMSGGAAVIHAVAIAAKLKLAANVVGLIPAVENAVGAGAMRPGDILTSLSGKTIEILHTDAEGRVILADALTYAKQYDPAIVADAATLTGAALTALGEQANALMTNREDLLPELQTLGEESGDYVWPMPLWEEYDYIVKGRFGDVPNIPAQGNSRYAGVIAGGKFLEVFTKELKCPWIHLDIAPKMTSSPEEYLAKGAAGAPIRYFLALIEKYGK